MSKKVDYPVAIFELIPQGAGSGFVREDTLGTANEDKIIHPKNRTIINRSVVKKEELIDGEKVFINVPIRYIYGQHIILESEQKAKNITPNANDDRIMFVNGMLTVPKDGATVGLYEFLKNHAQNVSNENRLEHLKPVFKEIKPAENAQQLNVSDFLISEAVMYIRGLVSENKGSYVYAEERIDALCNIFNVVAESPEQKVQSLLYFAKTNPQYFLTEAKKSEQTVLIEISHALQLKLISFEGNTWMYITKNEKIKSFPGNLQKPDAQTKALGNYFQSQDGKQAYEVFKVELAAAKQAKLEQQ